jgi:hypothetical protein
MEHAMMKSLVVAATCLLASVAQVQAGSKVLPECDNPNVEETLLRVSRNSGYTSINTVIQTSNIRSNDPTESRFCRSEVLTYGGRMLEFIYELRWTSETDGRYWLQMKGRRYL